MLITLHHSSGKLSRLKKENVYIYFTFLALKCEEYKDCFNCSVAYTNEQSCIWSQGKCVLSNVVTIYRNWYEKFSSCEKDTQSLALMKDSCMFNSKAFPFYANLSIKGENTFCMWNIGSIDTRRNIIIKIEKSEQSISDEDDYSLSIKYSDNSEIINIIEMDRYSIIETNVKELIFRYYTKTVKQEPPFIFMIDYEKNNLSKTTMVIIIVCTLIGLSFFSLLLRCILKKEAIIDKNGLSHIIVYDNSMKSIETKCSICLSDFNLKDKIISLECKHIFHVKCIRQWFSNGKKCPNCNNTVVITTDANNKLLLNSTSSSRKNDTTTNNIVITVNRAN